MHSICWLRKETVRIASDHLLAINLYTLSIFVYHWYKSNIKRVDIYERHGVSSAEISIFRFELRSFVEHLFPQSSCYFTRR